MIRQSSSFSGPSGLNFFLRTLAIGLAFSSATATWVPAAPKTGNTKLDTFITMMEGATGLTMNAGETPEAFIDRWVIAEAANTSQKLSNTIQNAFGRAIPAMTQASEVKQAIVDLKSNVLDRADSYVAAYHKEAKTQGAPYLLPVQVRQTVVQAAAMLYRGRGASSQSTKDGWYLTHRSAASASLQPLQDVLAMGLLDAKGKQDFTAFMAANDLNNADVKVASGFPKEFGISSPEAQSAIHSSLASASVAPDYRVPSPTAGVPITIDDVLADLKAKDKLMGGGEQAVKDFLGSMENSFYDESAAIAKDPNGKFPQWYGRQDEIKEMLDILTKGEKQHILIEGKAGVGKTTGMRMLQDMFMQGKISIRGEAPPIIVEVPITVITNPTDPTAIRKVINEAKLASRILNRRIILFVDEAHIATSMTQNAMKAFLTQVGELTENAPKIHVAFATTSEESKTFTQDTAFVRRWSNVHFREFNREEQIALVKQVALPRWKKRYDQNGWQLDGISDDAYNFAYEHRAREQRHSETGLKELLEAAIAAKFTRETNSAYGTPKAGKITLGGADVQQYLKEKFRMPFIPGDPDFKKNFEEHWARFEEDFTGNDALKFEMKQLLFSHFGQLHKDKVTALALFGPPGGGKSYAAEMVAKHFFGQGEDGKGIVSMNAAEYKEGVGALNKLIGTPVGIEGSKEQISILTQALVEHPNGFVLKIEEADYLPHEVIQFLTNMITEKKFTDGRGKVWDASKVVLIANSNIGQDLMISTDSANKMNWQQYAMRRAALTERRVLGDKEIEVVRPDKLKQVFDRFIEKIVMKGRQDEDNSIVNEEAPKQQRRWNKFYVLPPTRADLEGSTMQKVRKYLKTAKSNFGVEFDIPRETIMGLVDLDNYRFEEGHGYVANQLENKLFRFLSTYLDQRGQRITVHLEQKTVEIDGRELPSQEVHVSVAGGAKDVHPIGVIDPTERNPWGSNPDMMKRLRTFVREGSKHIKGEAWILQDMAQKLKNKAVDWNYMTTFTFLGTSGNGKTETAKMLAKVLFGDEKALFTITGIDHPWDFSEYFRPPTGIIGANKETDFEKWFKARLNAGGGVILFDELLSELGRNSGVSVDGQKGGKIQALMEIYEFLAEGRLKVGGKYYDARGFIPVITGNTLQEIFDGIEDNPEAERLVEKILGKLDHSQIVDALKEHGLDAPKVARLGTIYVKGPQTKETSLLVGALKLNSAIKGIVNELGRKDFEVKIDPRAIPEVVERLSTVRLGMREVNKGFETLVLAPLRTIISDIDRTGIERIKTVEMKLGEGGVAHWFVNGKEVVLEGVPIEGTGTGKSQAYESNWAFKSDFAPGSKDLTPGLKNVQTSEKMKFTKEAIETIAIHEIYGHWMARAILNHRNSTDFISLIPGGDRKRGYYLGYVRREDQVEISDTTLLTLLKDLISLEAGHRSVFLFGKYATGGGNGGDKRGDHDATDDLGKIEKLMNLLINNGLVPGVNESSPESKKDEFRKMMHELLDHVTDEVLKAGLESQQFKGIYDDVIAKRYATKEELDAYVKEKVDFKKVGGGMSKDGFLMAKVADGMAAILAGRASEAERAPAGDAHAAATSKFHAEQIRNLGIGLMGRLFNEALVTNGGDPGAKKEIEAARTSFKGQQTMDQEHLSKLLCLEQRLFHTVP